MHEEKVECPFCGHTQTIEVKSYETIKKVECNECRNIFEIENEKEYK